MGPTRSSLKRSLLLGAVCAVSLFPAVNAATTTTNVAESTTTAANAQSTSTQASATSTNSDMPNLSTVSSTTSASATSDSESTMSGLPSLTGTSTTTSSIPSYTVTIPDTSNAPFMNRSNLPDGTVFIAVGAILGAFGVAVLAWRGIVACLLHRSVERAAMAQHMANDKALAATTFPAPPAPFYKYTDRDSSPSLATGTAPGRGVRRSNRGPTPTTTPSQTNLFFSPTAAGGANPVGGGDRAGNRQSQYLPSGFYASAASPQPGHGHGQSISLSNLRPSSRGGGGGNTTIQTSSTAPLNQTPPDSPSLHSRSGNTPVPRDYSTSSVNLARPPSGRPPSAFLDDLLDEQQGQWPGHTGQQYGNSRGERY